VRGGSRQFLTSTGAIGMTGSWLRAWIRSGAGVYRRLLDVPLRCPFHVPLLIANCSFDQRRAAPDTRRQTFRWSIIAKAPKSQTRQIHASEASNEPDERNMPKYANSYANLA
jgi:hypothetical protein